MIKYVKKRLTADVLSYTIPELKYMTIETVTIENQNFTEDQYTLVGETFTITETDVKIETNDLLKIGYQWVKRN